jgi:hypothetical protein
LLGNSIFQSRVLLTQSLIVVRLLVGYQVRTVSMRPCLCAEKRNRATVLYHSAELQNKVT